MSVLRLLAVYNERDIIRENIEYFISKGIDTVVLDNYSKDGTYEILKEYEGRGIRWIARHKTDYFNIVEINTILLNLAKSEPEEFFIWVDADEILTVFDERFSLKDIIIKLFSIFEVSAFSASKIEFFHTEKEKAMQNINYSFKDFNYFLFQKDWKNVVFRKNKYLKTYIDRPFYVDENNKELSYKVVHNIFFIKHYPFRNLRQTKRKIFRGLKGAPISDKKFLNWHYSYFKDNTLDKIVKSKESLYKFENYPFFLMDFMISNYHELSKFYEKLYEKLTGG